jgi:cytochrome b
MPENQDRLIWDLPVRLFHWLLVACVAGSWVTHYAGVQWFPWHRRCGYAVLVLVAFRVVWGFVGTFHARFGNFLRGPRAIFGYMRGGGVAPSPGHNPLGALSVVVLLALLLFQAFSGLFSNDEIANAGPFYGWVTHAQSNRLTGLHHANSELLLVFIGLHVAAVLWYTVVRRQSLIRSMISGRKSGLAVDDAPSVDGSRLTLAVAIAAALAAVLALAVRAAPEASVVLF